MFKKLFSISFSSSSSLGVGQGAEDMVNRVKTVTVVWPKGHRLGWGWETGSMMALTGKASHRAREDIRVEKVGALSSMV